MPKLAKSSRSSGDAAKGTRTQVRVPATGGTKAVKGDQHSLGAKKPASSGLISGVLTQAQLDSVLAHVKAMTPEQWTQSFKDAGILTKSGKLAKPYRDWPAFR